MPGPSSPTATWTSAFSVQSATTIVAPGGAYLAPFSSSKLEDLGEPGRVADGVLGPVGIAFEPMASQEWGEAGEHLVHDRAELEAPHVDGQQPVGPHRVQDRAHQLVQALHLARGRLVPVAHLRVLWGGRLGQEVQVGADDGQRCPQLVGDDRDQLGARVIDAAQAVELRLGLEVQAAALHHAGQKAGDGRQAPDLGRREVAARLGLDVQDADDLVPHCPAARPGSR